jgi:hypothetical protein
MKFLKPDGTVEEGEPLTDAQANLRQALEEYLHHVTCKGSFHNTWEGQPRCQKASNYLSIIFTTIDANEFGDEISDEVKRLTTPKPKPVHTEPGPVDKASDDDVESPIAIPADRDLF